MNYCLEAGTLQAYLDGELSEAERHRVASHLEDCSDCADRLENWRALSLRVDGLLGVLSETPVAELKPQGWRPHWAAWAGVAAALAIMASLSLDSVRTRVVNLMRPGSIAVSKPASTSEYFTPLDDSDEPIETGEIARINLPASLFDPSEPAAGGKTVVAEVILDVSGEPKAIRFLQ